MRRLLLAVMLTYLAAADATALCGSDVVSRCLHYWNTDVVFVGTVTEITRVRVGSDLGGARLDDAERVQLEVNEAFRGVTSASMTIINVLHSEAAQFEMGKPFIVYADRNEEDGTLRTNLCAGTRRVEQAEEDLNYARWIATNPSGGRVGIAVYHEQWDPDANESRQYPFPDRVQVTLTGNGRSWTASPRANGPFGQFDFDVPLGTYELRVTAPPPLVAETVEPFTVEPPGRCYKRSVLLKWPGTIRGRVLDSRGRPVPGVGVVVVAAKFARRQRGIPAFEQAVVTDERGEFAHDRLGPGTYVIGIHIDDESRGRGERAFYFPGVAGPEESSAIDLGVAAEIDIGDFQLPLPVDKRLIEGVVLMADGSPAAGARIGLYSEERAFDALELFDVADAAGRFAVWGLFGRAYQVSAYADAEGVSFEGTAHATAGAANGVVIRLKAASY